MEIQSIWFCWWHAILFPVVEASNDGVACRSNRLQSPCTDLIGYYVGHCGGHVLPTAGANQPVHSFLGGKGLGIQQGTSV